MTFEQNHTTLFENSSDSIIVVQNGLLKHINSRGFADIGYEPHEIIDHHFKDFVFKDDLPLVLQRYEKRLNHEPVPEVYPFRLVTKKGDKIWFEIHAIEIEWEGAPASLTFFNNINKRKLAEEALSRSESQTRAVLNAIPDTIFQIKKNGVISKFQPPKKLKSFFPDIYTGRHLKDVLLEEYYHDCLSIIERAFKTKEVHVFEYHMNQGMRFDCEARIVAFQEDEVLCVVRDITQRKLKEESLRKNQENLENEIKLLKSSLRGEHSFEGIVGTSDVMAKVFDQILKAATSNAPVIIYGESGTGKELVARAIHSLSKRSSQRFVPVNCGATPENLLESEFFGYKKGAFSGAVSDKKGFLDLAESGTLFMDEVGEIGLNMQVKLLRAIEGGGYIPIGGDKLVTPEFRIIGATNKKPLDLVRDGLIREDFFFRINIIQIDLPPLRERIEDLPLLTSHFLKKIGKGINLPPIPQELMSRLMAHSWPGNVRELQNVIHRFVTMGSIDLPDISKNTKSFFSLANQNQPDLKTALREFEKNYILKILEDNKWHKGKTAAFLGIHRKTLFRKLTEFGVK